MSEQVPGRSSHAKTARVWVVALLILAGGLAILVTLTLPSLKSRALANKAKVQGVQWIQQVNPFVSRYPMESVYADVDKAQGVVRVSGQADWMPKIDGRSRTNAVSRRWEVSFKFENEQLEPMYIKLQGGFRWTPETHPEIFKSTYPSR